MSEIQTAEQLFQIRHRISNEVLFEQHCGSLSACLEAGVKAGADLTVARYGEIVRDHAGKSTEVRWEPWGALSIRSGNLTELLPPRRPSKFDQVIATELLARLRKEQPN